MKIDPRSLKKTESYFMLLGAINPRPIAWISTVGEDGTFNLAPYSFFQGISAKPPIICFSTTTKRDGGKKDTLLNIESGKDFVINTVPEDLAEKMNQTSAEYALGVDEFKEVGLRPIKSEIVKSPRVEESPVNLECQLRQVLQFGEDPDMGFLIIGDVVQIHVKDEYYVDGQIDGANIKNIGRLWGNAYCRLTDVFEMNRPGTP